MKSPDRLFIMVHDRYGKRRVAAQVLCFEVSAELDQEAQKIISFSADGKMQRRVPTVETCQATMKGFRIFVHDLADQLGIAQRDRGKNMMPGTALDEQVRNFAVCVRPSDRVELVYVPISVGVSPCVEQRANYRQVPVCSSPMQRIRVVASFAGIRVRAVFEQQLDRADVSTLCRGMQSCPTPAVQGNQLWIAIKQLAQASDVALLAGIKKLRGDLLDVRSQRSPTRKSVVARDRQLRRSQFCSGITAAYFAQSILGSLFQVFERGTLREL